VSFKNIDAFVRERRPVWEALAFELVGDRPLAKRPAAVISRVARLYREVCTDRMRAERLGLNPSALHYVDALVSRAHAALYDARPEPLSNWRSFVIREFPRALRKNGALFGIACFLFFVPFALTLSQTLLNPEAAARILPIETLEQMAEAYSKEPSGRTGGEGATMAGFYVYNNVGIAFRCFATGILFGLGTAFFLVYNGAITGAITGHVIQTGGGINILTFIAGHAPLELTAIVISGAAGLEMGRALLVTHGRTRLGSLWHQRHGILAQVVGAALMLLAAAAVEGFWSPSSAPARVKWGVGIGLMTLVVLHLGFAGRRKVR